MYVSAMLAGSLETLTVKELYHMQGKIIEC